MKPVRGIDEATTHREIWSTTALAFVRSLPAILGPCLALAAFASCKLALRGTGAGYVDQVAAVDGPGEVDITCARAADADELADELAEVDQ